jgi:hypothetical protein
MAERLDTADDYGRSEGCFIDHRSPPFCFEDYVAGLQETKEPVDANGLISVSDLQPGILPNPTIRIDDLDQTDTEESILLELQSDPMSQQRSNYLRNVSDLLHRCYVPLEVVQLDSDPDIDVADYLSIVSDRSNPDLVKQWLPFCPIRHDKGEGLDYPPHSNRFRCLLLRELEIERITVPEAALNICQLIETDLKAEFDVKLPRNGNVSHEVPRTIRH